MSITSTGKKFYWWLLRVLKTVAYHLTGKKESYEEAMGSEVQSREEHIKISTEIEDNNYFWFGSTNTS